MLAARAARAAGRQGRFWDFHDALYRDQASENSGAITDASMAATARALGLDPQTRASIWRYIRALKDTEGTTVFMTTHYMDEAEYCDRIAIMDNGRIIVIDTPEALKASVGQDRVQIQTDDDELALSRLRERFELEPTISEGQVTFHVTSGEQFVPRLFAELGVGIRGVRLARPSLDDVFMSYTGSTIRDAEATSTDRLRTAARVMGR